MLLEMAGEDDGKRLNDIQRELDMDVFDIRDTNEYHKKGKALKRDYERLHRLATNQPVESPFNEPKASASSLVIVRFSCQLSCTKHLTLLAGCRIVETCFGVKI